MQGLETILEPRDGHGNIGAVWTDVDAFAAHVVALQAAAGFLLDKSLALVFIHQRDGDSAFTLIHLRRIDIVPDFIPVAAGDILPRQDHVRGPPRVADSGDDRRGAALNVANQKDVRLAGLAIGVDHRPALRVERDPHCRQRFAVLLLADGGNQGVDFQRAKLIGFYRTAAAFLIRLAQLHHAYDERSVGVKLFRVA